MFERAPSWVRGGTGLSPRDSSAPLSVPWLGPAVLERVLAPGRAREAVANALAAEASGAGAAPLRQVVDLPEGALFVMPAAVGESLAVKILNDRPRAASAEAPALRGVVVLFQRATGLPLAIMDGAVLTALRTGGIAGWATERLARSRRRFALVGAGFQARYQAEAVLDLGGVEEVSIWNRGRSGAEALAERLRHDHPGIRVEVLTRAADAVARADVVTVVTRSQAPIVTGSMVRPTVHVNAMGAFRPSDRELSGDLVAAAAAVYADTVGGVMAEAGDVLLAIREGLLTGSAVRPLHAAAAGSPPAGMTVMKSVGAAVFDVAAAEAAYRAWRQDPTASAASQEA